MGFPPGGTGSIPVRCTRIVTTFEAYTLGGSNPSLRTRARALRTAELGKWESQRTYNASFQRPLHRLTRFINFRARPNNWDLHTGLLSQRTETPSPAKGTQRPGNLCALFKSPPRDHLRGLHTRLTVRQQTLNLSMLVRFQRETKHSRSNLREGSFWSSFR